MGTKKVIAVILETALRIIILLIVISLVYKAGNFAYGFGYSIFAEKPMTLGTGRDVVVTIPEDKSVREIGEILRQHGLIRDANLFFCQELLSAYHGKLEEGTYTLNTSMTSTQMMAIMAESYVEEEEEDEDAERDIPVREDIEDMEPLPRTEDASGDAGETEEAEAEGSGEDEEEEAEGSGEDEEAEAEGPRELEDEGDIDVIDAVVESDE